MLVAAVSNKQQLKGERTMAAKPTKKIAPKPEAGKKSAVKPKGKK